MAVGYGRLRPSFLAAPAASAAHRAIGDAIVVLTILVAAMCIFYVGFEDDAAAHVIAATALLAVLALKLVVVRWWHRLDGLLPALGASRREDRREAREERREDRRR